MENKSLIRTLKATKANVAAALLTVILIGCPLLRAQAPHRTEPKPPRLTYSNKVNKETPPGSLNLDPTHPKPRDDSRTDSRREYEKYEKPKPEGGAGLVFLVVFLVAVIGYGLVAALTLGKWLFENSAPQK